MGMEEEAERGAEVDEVDELDERAVNHHADRVVEMFGILDVSHSI
jgi:hypothetical protein